MPVDGAAVAEPPVGLDPLSTVDVEAQPVTASAVRIVTANNRMMSSLQP